MAIYADTNLFPGVNPHLNSYLQLSKEGMWESFHVMWIARLCALLDQILPPGYYDALAEKSLQIGEYESQLIADVRTSSAKSDVAIYQTPRIPPIVGSAQSIQAATPTYSLPLSSFEIDDEDTASSVVIYEVRAEDGRTQPITRIELLSPSNKPGRSYYERYMRKRGEILQAGLRLVEIDFLHHTRPILDSLPSYRDQEVGASPYVILVSDPRPSFQKGGTAVYLFGALDRIPIIRVPLERTDTVDVDFGSVYNEAVSGSRRFRTLVDYASDPPALDRFSAADQQALRGYLETIRRERAQTP